VIRTPEELDYWRALVANEPERDDVAVILASLVARPAWQADAACRTAPVRWFFPVRGEDVRPAKALCAACPVAVECARFSEDEEHGIWAGTSGRARRRPAPQREAA
jgi:WhiB family redox-sensing transcriptional regulator